MNPIKTIGIIGLGYVGLPLAVEFGKKYKTFGYDINNIKNKKFKKILIIIKKLILQNSKNPKN